MVRDSMCFDTFCDFYDRREYIRAAYIGLDKHDKTLYKYYVYSRRILKDKVCDMIWEYLNSYEGEEFVNSVCDLSKERSKYL